MWVVGFKDFVKINSSEKNPRIKVFQQILFNFHLQVSKGRTIGGRNWLEIFLPACYAAPYIHNNKRPFPIQTRNLNFVILMKKSENCNIVLILCFRMKIRWWECNSLLNFVNNCELLINQKLQVSILRYFRGEIANLR